MSSIFVIGDEIHAEQSGEYSSFDEALDELRRRADIPWDQPTVLRGIINSERLQLNTDAGLQRVRAGLLRQTGFRS